MSVLLDLDTNYKWSVVKGVTGWIGSDAIKKYRKGDFKHIASGAV